MSIRYPFIDENYYKNVVEILEHAMIVLRYYATVKMLSSVLGMTMMTCIFKSFVLEVIGQSKMEYTKYMGYIYLSYVYFVNL